MRQHHRFVLPLLACTLACAAPSSSGPAAPTPRGSAPVAVSPDTRPDSDQITVDDYRRVCEALARDLVRQPFIANAASPPVVTIRQLQNKSDLDLDDAIFQETIRVKLMQQAGGKVLFRDDVSYQDILRERVRASDEDVEVTLTDSVAQQRAFDRNRDYGYETGSLSGGSTKHTERTQVQQSATIKGGVAKADYFLRGIVYQMAEDPAAGRHGSYFQYQFRIVDAHSGIIVWEKMLDSRPGDPYVQELASTMFSAPPPSTTATPAPGATRALVPAVAPPAPIATGGGAPAPLPASSRILNPPTPPTTHPATAAATSAQRSASLAAAEPTGVAFTDDFDFGRFHALVVGNAGYRTLPRLGASANDAREVAALLEHDYGFEVKLLLDAERRDIISAFTDYRQRLGAGDSLLVYYAGHGWFDEDAQQGYWLPVEASDSDPSDWISNATINDMLRANQADHILVVADSCYSGTLTRGLAVRDLSSSVYRKLAGRRSRTALTSGGLEPVEDDGGQGNSVFAEAFMTALHNNPGILDGQGLFAELRRPVMVNADQTPEYGDIRKAGHDGGDFLFVKH